MESRALIVGALTAALPFMLGTATSASGTWGLVTTYLGAVGAVTLFKKLSPRVGFPTATVLEGC